MLALSRILVPVDFSERCLGMMPYVKAIAAKYDAAVVLLHVVNPFYAIPATGISGPTLIPVPQSLFQEKGEQLDRFAAAELPGVQVQRFVYQGDPVAQIVAFAHAEDIRLIVMPTHGYGPLRRFLIGSVTSKVLHDASCPVLTGIHMEEQPAREAVQFSNILCAVDLGPQSQQTLLWAFQLATDFHAKLGIVHALPALYPGVTPLLSPDFKMELERLAKSAVETLQSAVGAESARIYTEEGEPAETVCSFARSIGADLLVIGRGPERSPAGRLTTHAYAIVRQSPCPVISV